MSFVLYFLCIFLNLYFAVKKKQSRTLILFTFVLIILLIGGAGPSYTSLNHSRDYLHHENTYNNSKAIGLFDSPEFSHTILLRIGNLLNLNFFIFRLLIYIAGFLLLYKYFILRHIRNVHFYLLLYMIYPMLADSEHFRNFIALTIFLISINYIETDSIKDRLIFILFILLAASFHITFILFLPSALINIKKNKLLLIIVPWSILLFILVFLNDGQLPFQGILFEVLEYEKPQFYLSRSTNLGFLIPITFQSISILLVLWTRKIFFKVQKKNESKILEQGDWSVAKFMNKEEKLFDLILGINIVGLFFFPFFLMSTTFIRLPKHILMINFLGYSLLFEKIKHGSFGRLFYAFVIILSVVAMLIMNYVIITPAERVLIPFFTQNYFFYLK